MQPGPPASVPLFVSYRSDVDALTARHAALDAEVARVAKERDELRLLIDDDRARVRLPVLLDNIRVASPCTETWSAMRGDGRVRHCGTCDQNVYDLSELTRTEAEALLREKEGKLCARYYRRSDGAVMTKDCPSGTLRPRRGRWYAGAIVALFGLIAGWLSLRKPEPEYTLGSVGYFEPPPATLHDVLDERFPTKPEH